jgi:hypothetical protein
MIATIIDRPRRSAKRRPRGGRMGATDCDVASTVVGLEPISLNSLTHFGSVAALVNL